MIKKPSTEWVHVTPKMAEEWLKSNIDNRPADERMVQKYAGEMSEGRWKVTGDPIRFDMTGRVIDGQHRLMAIILSQKPQMMLVVRGLPPDSFKVIDTGKVRNVQTILAMAGHKNTVWLKSVATWVYAYSVGRHGAIFNPPQLTAEMVEEVIAKHSGMLRFVSRSSNSGFRSPLASACAYLFSLIDEAEAERWLEDMTTGANLEQDDPVLRCREVIMNRRVGRNGRAIQVHRFQVMVKSWNARRTGIKKRILYSHNEVEIDGLPPAEVDARAAEKVAA